TDDDFVDLCKGPHLPSTGRLGVVKLLSVAGAYWHGDERRQMLSRIYGVAFPKKKQLDEFLEKIEEAKRRDHRKLGAELDLFSFAENYGPGMVLYHPTGAVLHYEIERLGHEMHQSRGYSLVHTPHLFRTELWKISGHYDHYKDRMFFAKLAGEEGEYAVKPMNCPGHVLIYSHRLHSYRELPIRYYEFGHVYRNELSGVLHGMLRVRGFTIDDAHIFCTPGQLEDEIVGVLRFAEDLLAVFGLPMNYTLSTRPHDSMGSDEVWELATSALEHALAQMGVDYDSDIGGGAFYGPKIDIHVTDALGRKWQTTTCQVDFNFPDRFDLNYVGEDGRRHRVVMVHRAILGSFERFIGVLIEHFAGRFPLWLAPEQVRVLPVAGEFVGYADEVADRFNEEGFRVRVDRKDSKLGAKIALAE
ncbi:threonine--tRNA ligase, partial [bacterium]|nr:threonine--tRNA ligase [bacterium]